MTGNFESNFLKIIAFAAIMGMEIMHEMIEDTYQFVPV